MSKATPEQVAEIMRRETELVAQDIGAQLVAKFVAKDCEIAKLREAVKVLRACCTNFAAWYERVEMSCYESCQCGNCAIQRETRAALAATANLVED